MQPKLTVIARKGCFYPADLETRQYAAQIQGVKFGLQRLTVKNNRSRKHQRFMWKILELIAEALNSGGQWTGTKDDLYQELKILTGLSGPVKRPMAMAEKIAEKHGLPVESCLYEFRSGSTSFEKMSQAQFSIWAENAICILSENVFPYIVNTDEWKEIENMLMREKV